MNNKFKIYVYNIILINLWNKYKNDYYYLNDKELEILKNKLDNYKYLYNINVKFVNKNLKKK